MTRETLLDTDVLSLVMRRRPDAVFHAKEYLKHHPRLSISAITAYEVMRGLKTQGAAAKLADFHVFCRASRILPCTFQIAEIAANIYADLKQRGELLDHADILIAATAIAHDCCLATNNAKHFSRIPRLSLVGWTS
ncbi:MAG TPA: type II toxin-antitoxin system VapC family toxin [Lacipirellula sp.]